MARKFRYDTAGFKGFHNTRLNILIGIAIIAVICLPAWYYSTDISLTEFINPWGPAEFLINYEGGFVRRGLIGELLYLFCSHTGINPLPVIYIASYTIYISVAVIMIRYFCKKEWAWWIVFSLCLCGYVGNIVRKDYLMYLLICAIMLAASGLNRKKSRNLGKIALIYLIATLGMLIHEGFIFFGLGVACLYLWRGERMPYAAAGLALSGCLLFGIAAWAKGDTTTVEGIHRSLNSLGTLPPMPENGAIDALKWETGDTFMKHLAISFRAPYHMLDKYPIWNWAVGITGWILRMLATYYLMTNLPAVFSYGKTEDERLATRDGIGALMIITWVTMLPMFTVLCCDRNRTMQFWAMGAYIPAMFISGRALAAIIPARLAMLTRRLNDLLVRILAPRGGILIFLMLLMLLSEVVTVLRKI